MLVALHIVGTECLFLIQVSLWTTSWRASTWWPWCWAHRLRMCEAQLGLHPHVTAGKGKIFTESGSVPLTNFCINIEGRGFNQEQVHLSQLCTLLLPTTFALCIQISKEAAVLSHPFICIEHLISLDQSLADSLLTWHEGPLLVPRCYWPQLLPSTGALIFIWNLAAITQLFAMWTAAHCPSYTYFYYVFFCISLRSQSILLIPDQGPSASRIYISFSS